MTCVGGCDPGCKKKTFYGDDCPCVDDCSGCGGEGPDESESGEGPEEGEEQIPIDESTETGCPSKYQYECSHPYFCPQGHQCISGGKTYCDIKCKKLCSMTYADEEIKNQYKIIWCRKDTSCSCQKKVGGDFGCFISGESCYGAIIGCTTSEPIDDDLAPPEVEPEPEPEPTHKECIDGQCIAIDGEGEDECIEDNNCAVETEEPPTIEEPTEPTKRITITGDYIILNENFPDDVYSSPIAFYIGVLPVGKIVRTLINFDLRSLENKEIKKAKLVINKIPMLYGEEYGKQTTEVHKVMEKWYFYSASWNNQPSFDTTVVSSKEITGNGKYTFDITPIMDYLIEHETGVLLKAEDEETTNLKKFAKAYLNIWYTEEEETKNCEEMGGNCRFLIGCKNDEIYTADYGCPFWGKCCMPEEEPEETKNCEKMGGNCRFLIGCRDEEIYTADYGCSFWGKCCMPD